MVFRLILLGLIFIGGILWTVSRCFSYWCISSLTLHSLQKTLTNCVHQALKKLKSLWSLCSLLMWSPTKILVLQILSHNLHVNLGLMCVSKCSSNLCLYAFEKLQMWQKYFLSFSDFKWTSLLCFAKNFSLPFTSSQSLQDLTDKYANSLWLVLKCLQKSS